MMDRSFITFQVGLQTFALPITFVLQIVRLPALTILADAPPAIAGLLHFHGHLLPVLIGHVLLDQPGSVTLDSLVIILGSNITQPSLGLLVDEVYDVVQVPTERLAPLSYGSELLQASLRIDDQIILVLDSSSLLEYANPRQTVKAIPA
ncbi:chemotaxis protein CheW [Chloroflexus sp. Y-396-1]|uniref:chemotaxis protein CheW n=1 Tax=Chloroflexus sp. Y-396-1 TaxID=867845 RepID=UPI0004900A99|nr:chemotaxis protein CheW [Chloroflexus sp. Y-396-1]